MKQKRILLVSVGGVTGTYILKHLKETKDYYLVGCDVKEEVALKNNLDAYYIVPLVTEESYPFEIDNVVSEEAIDIIIPITSYDMMVFGKDPLYSKYKDKMLIMPYNSCIKYHNKESAYKQLNKIGIKTPEIYHDEIVYPCILKPIVGSGSKNTFIIKDIDDYKYYSNKTKDYLICEYLDGTEYTVDCLFDNNGKCLGYNARSRMKVNGGGAVTCKNVVFEELKDVINKLENIKEIVGAINFQFKFKDNEICVFDFNTRFASGGMALTVESGLDIPNLLIDLIGGESIKFTTIKDDAKNKMMIRYYDEYYVD